jgi:hypothetical protein
MRYLTSHSTNDILNEYTSLDPVAAMQKYFASTRLLPTAIAKRATDLGLAKDDHPVVPSVCAPEVVQRLQ